MPPTKKTAKKAAPAKKVARKAPAKKATMGKASLKKSPAKAAATAKKSTSGKTAAKKSARKPSAAFMKKMKPSAELAAVIGSTPMPRTEVTKKLWDYIKKHNLQDPKQRRMINADDKLKPVFGGKKQVSMFDMTKLVNKHLSEA